MRLSQEEISLIKSKIEESPFISDARIRTVLVKYIESDFELETKKEYAEDYYYRYLIFDRCYFQPLLSECAKSQNVAHFRNEPIWEDIPHPYRAADLYDCLMLQDSPDLQIKVLEELDVSSEKFEKLVSSLRRQERKQFVIELADVNITKSIKIAMFYMFVGDKLREFVKDDLTLWTELQKLYYPEIELSGLYMLNNFLFIEGMDDSKYEEVINACKKIISYQKYYVCKIVSDPFQFVRFQSFMSLVSDIEIIKPASTLKDVHDFCFKVYRKMNKWNEVNTFPSEEADIVPFSVISSKDFAYLSVVQGGYYRTLSEGCIKKPQFLSRICAIVENMADAGYIRNDDKTKHMTFIALTSRSIIPNIKFEKVQLQNKEATNAISCLVKNVCAKPGYDTLKELFVPNNNKAFNSNYADRSASMKQWLKSYDLYTKQS